ncbi:hypothetical protein T10_4215 [Trichinella papuae]|uniref:Uncharacterized protein n=1 Tax=Trichinella papuae TaxID=268474 RepID=A0A0V1LYR4_9BILA|nr:hypothetical protein T10_4215 [Trichinella papuae]
MKKRKSEDRTTRSRTRTARSRTKKARGMRFPVGPHSVSLGLGYFERVKLSHILGLLRSKIYVCNCFYVSK